MKWLYYQFLHQPLMKLAHRFDWHRTHVIGPLDDGCTIIRCGWCGLQQVKQPHRIMTEDELLAALRADFPR